LLLFVVKFETVKKSNSGDGDATKSDEGRRQRDGFLIPFLHTDVIQPARVKLPFGESWLSQFQALVRFPPLVPAAAICTGNKPAELMWQGQWSAVDRLVWRG